MGRAKLDYKVENNIDELIKKEIGKRMAQTGIKVLHSDIMNEMAEYCGVGIENIKRIKRNTSQPSLAVALNIAHYFDEKVENIFKIV